MPTYLPGLQFPIYSGWTNFTPVIPKMYWDAYSQEQIIKELCKNYARVEQYLDYIASLMNEWNIEFSEEMQAEFEKIWNSIYDEFETDVKKWIDENLKYIYKYTIKQIYFALDDTGHLVAYIPESWQDINFWTPLDYSNQETYGHLQILLNDVVPYIEEVI